MNLILLTILFFSYKKIWRTQQEFENRKRVEYLSLVKYDFYLIQMYNTDYFLLLYLKSKSDEEQIRVTARASDTWKIQARFT